MKRILAIDGGGMRGYAAALYLRDNSLKLGAFDLLAGTSTGGIIALALAYGRSPSEIVHLYETMGPKIFPRRRLRKLLLPISPRYSAGPLEAVLRDEFGDKALSYAHTPVLVAAHDATPGRQDRARGAAYFFREDKPYTFFDAARATSAAPTYFPAYRHDGHVWIDGGLYMNNPSGVAAFRAMQLWPGQQLEIVSIGTGYVPDAEKGWPRFPLQQFPATLYTAMDGSADLHESLARQRYKEDFTRIDFPLADNIEMDDCGNAAMTTLRMAAKNAVVTKGA